MPFAIGATGGGIWVPACRPRRCITPFSGAGPGGDGLLRLPPDRPGPAALPAAARLAAARDAVPGPAVFPAAVRLAAARDAVPGPAVFPAEALSAAARGAAEAAGSNAAAAAECTVPAAPAAADGGVKTAKNSLGNCPRLFSFQNIQSAVKQTPFGPMPSMR